MTTLSSHDIQPPDTAGVDSAAFAKSRDYCLALTRREAKNFYYGLKLLPEPKRSAMYALYAYMRLVDDIADDDANKRTLAQRIHDLDQWEALTQQAIAAALPAAALPAEKAAAGLPRGHILWPAFAHMIATYGVPAQLFADMIAGQRQDLHPVSVPDFSALYSYCYRVASVVGVASLYIWGFDGGEGTLKLGVARGIAFQLTNILRDLREDAARGRCYLPLDELASFGLSADNLASGVETPEFHELMRFQIARAQRFFQESAGLECRITTDSRPTLRAMTAIYHGLLEKIAAKPQRVLHNRVALSTWAKLRIGWSALRAS